MRHEELVERLSLLMIEHGEVTAEYRDVAARLESISTRFTELRLDHPDDYRKAYAEAERNLRR